MKAAPTTIEGSSAGDRLFFHREARGWTQTEVARRSGVNRVSVVFMEGGKTTPRPMTVKRIARAFGLTVEQFLHGPIPEREAKK